MKNQKTQKNRQNNKQNKKSSVKSYYNIGFIFFGLLFVYLIVNIFCFFNRKQIPLSEARFGSIIDNENFSGIIIRDEKLIKSNSQGYVSYYFRECEKAAKNSIICSTSVSNNRANQQIKSTLDNKYLSLLKQQVQSFNHQNDKINFDDVYNFYYNYENIVLEFHQLSVNKVQDIVNKIDDKNQIYTNNISGIISYNIDGFEELKSTDIDLNTFNKEQQHIQLLAKETVKQGDIIYKIIDSENWKIVFPATDELLKYIEKNDKKSLTINLLNTTHKFKGKITNTYEKNKQKFIELSFTGYDLLLSGKRKIDFEIVYYKGKGIKIPNSAIVKKDFYKVPKEFLITNNNSKGVLKKVLKGNEQTAEFIKVNSYYSDEEYCYIKEEEINKDDVLVLLDNDKNYIIKNTVALEGVYDVNKGYINFNFIEKIIYNDSYTIINTNTKYGLNIYDIIVIDCSQVKENQLIY